MKRELAVRPAFLATTCHDGGACMTTNDRRALIANIHRAAPGVYTDPELLQCPPDQLERIGAILRGTRTIP
jgi:hypothetical protein